MVEALRGVVAFGKKSLMRPVRRRQLNMRRKINVRRMQNSLKRLLKKMPERMLKSRWIRNKSRSKRSNLQTRTLLAHHQTYVVWFNT